MDFKLLLTASPYLNCKVIKTKPININIVSKVYGTNNLFDYCDVSKIADSAMQRKLESSCQLYQKIFGSRMIAVAAAKFVQNCLFFRNIKDFDLIWYNSKVSIDTCFRFLFSVWFHESQSIFNCRLQLQIVFKILIDI